MATKKALKQADKAARVPTIAEAKLAKEKRQHDEERRIVAAEQQAKATMELAKSNMEIATAIDCHGDILERSLLLLQPFVSLSFHHFSRSRLTWQRGLQDLSPTLSTTMKTCEEALMSRTFEFREGLAMDGMYCYL